MHPVAKAHRCIRGVTLLTNDHLRREVFLEAGFAADLEARLEAGFTARLEDFLADNLRAL